MFSQKANDINNSFQEQIAKFDNKANCLITIVGIIFALSLGVIETFNQFINIELSTQMLIKLQCLIAFFVLYFLSFTVELIFLLLIIYPRKKKTGEQSMNYYLDVASIYTDELKEYLIKNDNNIDADINQIKTNAYICKEKHKFLVIAIWSLIPLFAFMFAMLLTIIIL